MGGEPSSELCIESDAVSVERTGYGITIALILSFPVFFFVRFSTLWLVALVILHLIWLSLSARPRSARVHVEPGAAGRLAIERSGRRFSIARSEIVNSWHASDAGFVSVVVKTRRSLISVRVSDRATAEAFSRALGVDAAHQLVGTDLTGAPVSTAKRWRQFVNRHLPDFMVGLVMLPPLLLMLGGIAIPQAVLLTSLIGGGLLALAFAIARAAVPARVLVGRDGVLLVPGFGRRELIGYKRVRRVRVAPFAVTLTLANDEVILLPISPIRGKRFNLTRSEAWSSDPKRFAPDATRSLNRSTSPSPASATPDPRLPARSACSSAARDRSPSGAKRSRAPAAAPTASPQLDADALVDIVENPQSPVDQRLGAALALGDLRDDPPAQRERKSRVQAAISSSANPRVRIALEKAAEGTLDDDAYEAALDAEARPQSRARSGSS